MTQREVEKALLRVIESSHPNYTPRCWGWGAVRTGTMHATCADCGRARKATSVLEDGTLVCWRCAFWRHLPRCEAMT